jgi:hypothetical protein
METLVIEVLAAWRQADRLASTLPAGSVEQAAAQKAHDLLRDLYRDLTRVVPADDVMEMDVRAHPAQAERDVS